MDFFLFNSHGDITVYLLYTTSFVTLEEVKNFKSLHSYKYFTAGWVVEHRWKQFKDCWLVIGKVNHSYAVSSAPLTPWVIIRNSGAVACGHCTCMAGLGETCSHIGALLYWLEYQVRTREDSCTSHSNQWLEPKCVRQVPYLELERIDFTTAEKSMKQFYAQDENTVAMEISVTTGISVTEGTLVTTETSGIKPRSSSMATSVTAGTSNIKPTVSITATSVIAETSGITSTSSIMATSATAGTSGITSVSSVTATSVNTSVIMAASLRTTASNQPDESDVIKLFHKCSSSKAVPILFSIEDEPYCSSFTKSFEHLPLALQSLYDPAHLQCNYMELLEAGNKMKGILEISTIQQKHLEQLTCGQSTSKLWMRFRSGRITASRLYQVVHTDPHKPSVSLIKAICYPDSVRFTTAATVHGCEHEKTAINAYKLKAIENHQNLTITPAGLVLYSKKACFGASPDSFLECECCGLGVLEVKCPYSCKFATFDDVAERSLKFCLQKNDNGDLELDKSHPYFFQCQMQMLVTERLYCDFVVWASVGDIHIERISLDKNFIELQLEKAEKVFWLAVVPELLAKWYTRHNTTLPRSSATFDLSSEDDNDDDGTWCYCNTAKGGAMIGCENINCAIKWFHMECLKIKNKPKGKWFCPTCHPSCGRKRNRVRR